MTGLRCTYEEKTTAFAVVGDAEPKFQCGQPATEWPVVDDAYRRWERTTGDRPEEFQPEEKPLCAKHAAVFRAEVAGQREGTPGRVRIVSDLVAAGAVS